MLLTNRKSGGFRRSDEGDGAQGDRQHGVLDEGRALFQIHSPSRRPLTLSLTTGDMQAGFSKCREPRASGLGGPWVPRPGNGLPRGSLTNGKVGLFSTNDASGRGLVEPA